MKTVTVKRVAIADLVPAPVNANEMDPDTYASLVASMKLLGPDLQPPLVVPEVGPGSALDKTYQPGLTGRYHIVDGHHRIDAAREAGYTDMLVAVADLDEGERSLLGLGMNRMRGNLNLTTASEVLTGLVDEGVDRALLVLSGFSEGETTTLLAAGTDDGPTPELPPDDPEPDRPPAPFLLEVTFTSREDLKEVRRAIKRAAGKGRELAEGLLRLVRGG